MSYMIYEDSLARMYGAPGSGKSFVAMDMALSLAAGRSWGGRMLAPTTVVYVMAEGQAVNASRMDAWLSRNNVDIERIEERFFAVPDAIPLTEVAVRPFVEWVREHQPKLVVLDTKNAMMIGEENSATDFAAMRRALDAIRKASGCCVLLVDHTGYEGTRARGSSAGTAAMDTEIRVEMDSTDKPALVTAEVTRDKASEAGHRMAWRLMPEHPAAVLVPVDVPEEKPSNLPEWLTDNTQLPERIVAFEGRGAAAIVPLARYMRMAAGPGGDPSRMGRAFSDAVADLKDEGMHRKTLGMAWSALKSMGFLESKFESPTETQERTGAHVWNVP